MSGRVSTVLVLALVIGLTPNVSNADIVSLRADMQSAFDEYIFSIAPTKVDDLSGRIEEAHDNFVASSWLAIAQCLSTIMSVATVGTGAAVAGSNDVVNEGYAMFYAADPSVERVSLWIDDEEIVAEMSPAATEDLFSADVILPGILKPGLHTIAFRAFDSSGVSFAPVESTFEIVPIPGAVLLGTLGLSIVGLKLRKHA